MSVQRRTIGRGVILSTALAAGLALAAGEAAASPLSLGFWVVPATLQPPAETPPGPPPVTQPQRRGVDEPTDDPAVDRIIGDLERATAPRRSIDPVTPPAAVPARPGAPLPGVRPLERGAGAGKLLPDGTFLPSRRGRMSRSPSGDWVFNFDTDATGLGEPPMVLLRCQTLMEMEGHALWAGDAAVLTVSGQVFVYHGRNYLLPTLFQPTRRSEEVIPLQ